MKTRVALYARVSTDGQSVENQLRELEAIAVKEGWEVVEKFVDKGISGSKGREGRPAFDALCKGVVRREHPNFVQIVKQLTQGGVEKIASAAKALAA